MMVKSIQEALESASFYDLKGRKKLIATKSTFAGTGRSG
jgi:hypothetical protein